MSSDSLMRRVLSDAIALSKASRTAEAVARLEEGLQEARQMQDAGTVSALARHAGLLSFCSGENQRAVAYYEEALALDPADIYLHLAIAEGYIAMGKPESVQNALALALDLAVQHGDRELVDLIRGKMASPGDVCR